MEKSTGGVSFDIRFIDSGNGTEDYSAVKSQSLVGVYDGDWSLEEDGTVNASMAFARRVGDIRSHGNGSWNRRERGASIYFRVPWN